MKVFSIVILLIISCCSSFVSNKHNDTGSSEWKSIENPPGKILELGKLNVVAEVHVEWYINRSGNYRASFPCGDYEPSGSMQDFVLKNGRYMVLEPIFYSCGRY